MAGMSGSDDRTMVAVIGTGIMGSAMARNLAAAGLNTQVWDRSARRPLGSPTRARRSRRRRGTRCGTRAW